MNKTLGASTSISLWAFAGMQNRDDPEFLKFGRQFFDGEELCAKLYEVFVALCAKGWLSMPEDKGSLEDWGWAYRHGFYMPCTDRVVLCGQVDMVNDGIPDHSGMVLFDQDNGEPSFVTVAKTHVRKGVAFMPFSTPLATTVLFRKKMQKRDLRISKDMGEDVLRWFTRFVSLQRDGRLTPAHIAGVDHENPAVAGGYGLLCQMTAATMNAWQDRRHVWLVNTGEPLLSRNEPTPIMLGVAEDHVKSLFYARSLPVTESGRKRPILHWVRAHARRIREGIDVDVSKHLRGNEIFEMGGFKFEITQPRKATKHG